MKGYYTASGYKGYIPGMGYVLFLYHKRIRRSVPRKGERSGITERLNRINFTELKKEKGGKHLYTVNTYKGKGRAITNGALITLYGREGYPYRRRTRHWEQEISILMKDFCIPKETINQIIKETKEETSENDTNQMKYQKAWAKFKSIIALK